MIKGLIIPWMVAWAILFVKYYERKRIRKVNKLIRQDPVIQMLMELEKGDKNE